MIARALAVAFAAGVASLTVAAWAEGPGSRIRTTPEVPQAMELTHAPTPPEVKGCDRLRPEQRDRCLAALRESTPGRTPSGPEATGMGTGAGVGASSGTSGGAGFGGSAPR